METLKKMFAEMLGTFVIVLFGCGTAVLMGADYYIVNSAYVATAFAFGLALVAMIYSAGRISGGHFNPAVSFAMLLSKKMCLKQFAAYVFAQIIGAIAGAAVIFLLFGRQRGLWANRLFDGNVLSSIAVEILITAVFIFTILGVTAREEYGKIAGLVAGCAMVLVQLFGIYFTGAGMNPARSLGVAVFEGLDAIAIVWVFIVGSLIGAWIAVVLWKILNYCKCRRGCR